MDDLDKKQYVENLNKAESEEEKKRITAEYEAQEMRLRRRSLGNIRFIGELYKIKIINGKIMHDCIRKLLLQTDEESLECLCRLVTTVGQVRDSARQRLSNNNTFSFSLWNKKPGRSRRGAISSSILLTILTKCSPL